MCPIIKDRWVLTGKMHKILKIWKILLTILDMSGIMSGSRLCDINDIISQNHKKVKKGAVKRPKIDTKWTILTAFSEE